MQTDEKTSSTIDIGTPRSRWMLGKDDLYSMTSHFWIETRDSDYAWTICMGRDQYFTSTRSSQIPEVISTEYAVAKVDLKMNILR